MNPGPFGPPRAKVPTPVGPSATVHRMDDRYERGRARFLEVHDEKALRAVEGLGELGHQIVAFVYGDLYTQPALSDRDGSSAPSWRSRRSAARRSCRSTFARRSPRGSRKSELREAIMLTASIAGFPPAMNATATLKSVLAERRETRRRRR